MAVKKTIDQKYGKVVAKVLSDKGNDIYDQRKLAPGKWFCTCMAYRKVYPKGIGDPVVALPKLEKFRPCKHQLKAWSLWKATKGNIPAGSGVIILDENAF